jgi:pimeloyl-ACP methyl ester carboxylesterase
MDLYTRILTDFLDTLGIEHPILLGHSFGAAVAIELALADPGRFPAMLLLSPAPLDGLQTPHYLYPVLESYRFDRYGLRQSLQYVMGTYVPPYLDDLATEAQMMHPANFTGNARLLSDWSVNGRTRRYTKPLMVASGYRDNLVSPSSARVTARAFPDGRYANLGDVGHSPQIEAPKRVRYLLDSLLKLTSGDDPR